MTNQINRRSFLGSAAATGSFLARYGVADRTANAAPVRITPPVVDQLTIQVLLDAAHDVFVSGAQVPDVRIDRVRTPASFGNRTLQSEWGLSLHLVSAKGTETKRYLLDYGFSGEALNTNLELLKIDLAPIDALILSHGHLDHLGGLAGFLKKHRGAMKADLKLYLGGEDAFCHRYQKQEDGKFQAGGLLDRRDLKAANVQPVLSELPIVVEGHAFTTGTVPRVSVERVLPNSFVAFGEKDGAGCAVSAYADHHFTAEELAGTPVPDQHLHEHATCFKVGDRGLVVITSCGHGGIINTLRRAQEVTGVEKIHALCGGFHLAPAQLPYLDQIMGELKKFNVDHVIPMHCSGGNFIDAAKREMPEKLIACTTGSRFTFTA
jgi:7,8-dihydropterin-6-yl-methyl-4-(beta-D-ribofuranosyl)aminobenzene 5'-phosphate synthase